MGGEGVRALGARRDLERAAGRTLCGGRSRQWRPLDSGDLLDAARVRLVRIQAEHKQQRRRAQKEEFRDPDEHVTSEERLRARMFSRYLGRLALRRPDVRRIQKTFFNDDLLTLTQAVRLLRQQAPRFKQIGYFAERGIDLKSHKSYWYDPDFGKEQPAGFSENTGIRVEWEHGCDHIKEGVDLDNASRHNGESLEVPGLTSPVTILRMSVFDQIRSVSVALSQHYDWAVVDATLFILTGMPPSLKPIEVNQTGGWRNDHTHFRLNISVEPWVSPRTVMNIYRDVQRAAIGRQSRPFSEKNLMLVDFVSMRLNNEEETPAWRDLMAEWNRDHRGQPEWQYDDVRIFSRDYKRTGRKLIFPSHGPYRARQKKK